MSRMRDVQSKKRGAALALALFAVVILLVTGMGLLRLGLQARVYAARVSDEIAARTAADAGLERAIAEMNAALSAGKDDSSSLSKPKEDQPLPNSDATYTYKIVANSIQSNHDFNITCTGRSGIAQKTLSARVTLSGPFEYAIFTENGITLKPNTVIDGYDSRLGDYGPSTALTGDIGTNRVEQSSITMGKDSTVNGDVAVGVGGDPAVVISAEQATITGSKYALDEKNELPAVTVPASVLALPPGPEIGKEPITLSFSAKYDTIYLGTGQSLIIDGPVTLYVTGDIGLNNAAEVRISDNNPNASLKLYLGGNLYCKNGGTINNLTKDPTKLKIYGLDSCTNMSFATAGIFYGAIYAPNTPIYIKSALEIYGSVVVNSFTQGASSNFHYDASLKDVGADVGAMRFRVSRWWE